MESKSVAKYFVTLIDNHSRWCEVRFLRNNSDLLNHFKEFKALVENGLEERLRCYKLTMEESMWARNSKTSWRNPEFSKECQSTNVTSIATQFAHACLRSHIRSEYRRLVSHHDGRSIWETILSNLSNDQMTVRSLRVACFTKQI